MVSKGEEGKPTVEVAHEALLHSWKVLQDLIREKEEIIVLRNRLYADAKDWDKVHQQDAGKANSELWSGSKLVRIVKLRKEQALPNLDRMAIEFIEASLAESERVRREREEQQRRDLDAARALAEAREQALQESRRREKEQKKANKKPRQGSIFLGFLFLVASSLGVMAWRQTKQAELNQAESLGRYAQSLVKNEQRDLDAFIVALKAAKILRDQHTIDPEALNALQEALDKRTERNRFTVYREIVTSVAITPDGKTLVSGSLDNTIKVWDLDFDSLLARSCDWVRDYLQNPYSDVRSEDRHLCDGIRSSSDRSFEGRRESTTPPRADGVWKTICPQTCGFHRKVSSLAASGGEFDPNRLN